MVSPSPALLLQYQKNWILDKSPLKSWLKGRQIGYSFTGTLGVNIDSVERSRNLWLLLSASQRQSFELAQKSRDHIQAFGAVEKGASGVTMETERWGFIDGVEVTQTLLTFPNGSRQMFLPAKPETVRGFSGNVFADEFAFHQNQRAIYKAVYPSITRGYRIEVGSTPNGEGDLFNEICTKDNSFSKHVTTIYDAVRDGLAKSVGMEDDAFIAMLRDGCDDETWEQEYCCKFISETTSLIPYEMISQAETVSAAPVVWLNEAGTISIQSGWRPLGRLYLGADIGRRKDLTVLIPIEELPSGRYVVRGIIRMRNVAFAEQKKVIRQLLQNDTLQIRRLCQDASGLGMQMAEELTTEFGTTRIEGVTFNMAVKEDLAVRTRRVFEENRIDIPEDRALRSALHAVRRIPTAAGHFRFDADRTDAGHADEFWALALGLMASSGIVISTDYVTPATRSISALSGGFL